MQDRVIPRRMHPGAVLPLVLAALLLALGLVACDSGQSAKATPGTRGSDISRLSRSGKASSTPMPCAPLPADEAIGKVQASVVRIETPPDAKGQASAGTGFVIASDVVLTNQHVVAGISRVRATFINGRPAIGQVVATNEAQDLALILVDTADSPPIVWGDDSGLKLGTPLAAIGYALDRRGPPAVTTGAYKQTYVDPQTGQAYLLSDVQLEHGDSGGPLFNQCGLVVGVNTAKIRGEDRAGLAIPEYLAQRWATEQIQQHK